MPDYLPDGAEAGTHNVPGIAGLHAAIRLIRQKGVPNILRYERRLCRLAGEGLARIPGVRVFTGPDQTGVLSFTLASLEPEGAARLLWQRGLALRAGLHCAPLAHQTAGTGELGTVRAGFSVFSKESDAAALVRAVAEIVPVAMRNRHSDINS